MEDTTWYFFCTDTCKANKERNKELVQEINNNINTIEERSRVSCLTYNSKIFMHYDYNYKDVEYLNDETLLFKDDSMSIYDLLGDIFIKILESKTNYKNIVCNIFTFKLNIREKIYTRTVIQNLFNSINNKTPVKIVINLINQELICIKDNFILKYTEPIKEETTKSNSINSKRNSKRNSRTKSESESENNGKKNIYFNINIRN